MGRLFVGHTAVPLGQDGVAHPQHAVLHAEDEHRQQARLLVARRQRRHGEAGSELALELLRAPELAGRVHEADRFRGRLTALREALALHGLALPTAAVVDDGGLDAPAGRAAWRTLRERGLQPSAVICSNDLIAAGVILECQAQGLRVPQDVSVSGYNDTALAAAFEPAITSVETPVQLHAQEVARVLLAALRDRQPIPRLRLPTLLHVRASTGPAP